jgi:hypothetical protein
MTTSVTKIKYVMYQRWSQTFNKARNQYNKNKLMNGDLENSFLLVYLSEPLIIMIWYIY